MDTVASRPSTPRRSRSHRQAIVPLGLGVAATLLTATGLSGLGDAPNPKASAADVAAYFVDRRDAVLAAAPFAYLGAIALVLFVAHVGGRLRQAGRSGAATLVTVGGAMCATYFTGINIVLTTIAYEVAATSPDTAKALFVGTILAVPLLGAGVVALLGGLAWGDWDTQLVPRWLVLLSAGGAAAAVLSLVSFAERGVFSPDVQQQISGNAVLLWPALTGGALAWRARRGEPSST
jgi:hypothetical protein